jgi:hypothetical protein
MVEEKQVWSPEMGEVESLGDFLGLWRVVELVLMTAIT